jgi:hypothetical protein
MTSNGKSKPELLGRQISMSVLSQSQTGIPRTLMNSLVLRNVFASHLSQIDVTLLLLRLCQCTMVVLPLVLQVLEKLKL